MRIWPKPDETSPVLSGVYKAAIGNLNPINGLSELIIEEIKYHQFSDLNRLST